MSATCVDGQSLQMVVMPLYVLALLAWIYACCDCRYHCQAADGSPLVTAEDVPLFRPALRGSVAQDLATSGGIRPVPVLPKTNAMLIGDNLSEPYAS